MNKDVWANCGDCGAELQPDDKQCPKCGSTKKAYRRESKVTVVVTTSDKATQKRNGHAIRKIIGNIWKPSGDPKLKDGVREDRDIYTIKDKYDQIVKDAKTGEVLHEEHTTLSEHNKRANKKKTKSGLKRFIKWLGIKRIIITIAASVAAGIILFVLTNYFNRPQDPQIISLPNTNAIENSKTVATVIAIATPDFNPPYYIGVSKRIINPNSYTRDMTIKFKTSDGFLFSPLQNIHMTQYYNIPSNFELDDPFEYKDTMIVSIKEFPAGFSYEVTFSVYTMNPDVYRDTAAVTYEVLSP